MTDQSTTSLPEIFFRESDRLQMGSCLAAIAKEGKSVVMYSQSNELLDYYGASFLRRLKNELTDSDIEVFMPADSEAMLQRFNQLLSNLSLDVATKARTGMSPEKVWVVHDANAMSAHELELLARLVQQFPGSGVSAVLMFSSETSPGDVISRQNKQFVSWALEMPTAEQKLSTIQQARKAGHEELAVQFFNRLIKRPPKADTPSVRDTEMAASAAAKAKAEKAPTKTAAARKKSSNGILWALIVIALLVLSVGVAAWMNPDTAQQVWEQGAKLMGAKDEAPKAEEPPGSPVALKDETAKDEANNPMPGPAPTDAKAQPASPAAEPVPPAAPPTPPAKEPVVDKVITELPEAAVQGRLWLKGLPAESFVIEHKSYASLKDAQAAIKGKEWLVNARIVPVFADGKDEALFAVVTGPFKTKERAKNAAIRLNLAKDVTIIDVPGALAQAVPNKSKP